MPIRPIRCFLFLVLAAFLAGSAGADTITLKSGEKLEGRILNETAEELTIQVQVSPTITDERTIPRDEIKTIRKTSPEELAYAEIRHLKPRPDSSMSVADYDRATTALEEFLTAYPRSARKPEIEKNIAALKQEKERVEEGEVKLRGRWLTREEIEKDIYHIQAELLYDSMAEYARRGNLSGALNVFERLRQDYDGARILPDAAELALRSASALKQQVQQRLQRLPNERKRWQEAVSRALPEDRDALLNADRLEEERAAAAVSAAQDAGLKWLPLLPRSEKSLKALERVVNPEVSRLNALPTQKWREAVLKAEQAREAIAADDLARAETLAKEAASLWPQYKDARDLQASVRNIRKEQERAAKEKPSPTPEILEIPGTDGQPAPPAGAAKPDGKPGSSPRVDDEEQAGEEKPFYLTIRGAVLVVAGVLLVIGLATMLGRKRAQPRED